MHHHYHPSPYWNDPNSGGKIRQWSLRFPLCCSKGNQWLPQRTIISITTMTIATTTTTTTTMTTATGTLARPRGWAPTAGCTTATTGSHLTPMSPSTRRDSSARELPLSFPETSARGPSLSVSVVLSVPGTHLLSSVSSISSAFECFLAFSLWLNPLVPPISRTSGRLCR